MLKYKSGLLCILLITFITISCSPTETVTSSATGSEFPVWYENAGFTSDSVFFSAYATAVSSDSLKSISRAEEQARFNLESRIAEKLETVRNQLEERGSTYARNSDFILTLRNAHAPVETHAELSEGIAIANENHFRGFAKVSVSKDALGDLLEAGFAGKGSFWAEFSRSDAYYGELQ
ncbi:MAG: hypothetical protein WD059_00700 [Balneolaceae bacterium]